MSEKSEKIDFTQYKFKSTFLREAAARGFLYDCTDIENLDTLMSEESISAYIGFDPTAQALHVGNALSLMIMRLLQKHGHRPIALAGGGTARIGDPSFRDEARALLSKETQRKNIEGIKNSMRQFIEFSDTVDGNKALLLNNADWLDKLSWLDVLEDLGPHFSISRMLSSDSVRDRLEREQGLTFLEFNYSLLQSYDFRELSRTHNVRLQLGGSDQWGNIVPGIELARRTDRKKLFGLTTPLVTTSSGKKMGKSAEGTAIWVSKDLYPVFDYWQFWRNTEDKDVGRFLKLFTDLDVEECERLGALKDGELNRAKEILATEATAIAHGRDEAIKAFEAAKSIFQAKKNGVVGDIPEITLSLADIETQDQGVPAFKLLQLSKLCASGGEARRLIRNGGASLAGEKIVDENLIVPLADLQSEKGVHLAAGKKRHARIFVR